jgi:hypothetical protein
MIDWIADVWGFLAWHLWQKWYHKWQHRNDTMEEARAELYRRWEDTLDAFKDEPATRELHDVIDGMNEIKRAFGDERKDSNGGHDV